MNPGAGETSVNEKPRARSFSTWPLALVFLLIGIILPFVSGCSVHRTRGTASDIRGYDNCVISEAATPHFTLRAHEVLGSAFTIVPEDDTRLESYEFRRRTAVLRIDWRRGFWSTSMWVDLLDLESNALILRSYKRAPGLWQVEPDHMDQLLADLAAARKTAPARRSDPKPLTSQLRLYDAKSVQLLEGYCDTNRSRCFLSLPGGDQCDGEIVIEQRGVMRSDVASSAGGERVVGYNSVSRTTVVGGYGGSVRGTSELENLSDAVIVMRCGETMFDCKLKADLSSGQGHGECTASDSRKFRLTLIPDDSQTRP